MCGELLAGTRGPVKYPIKMTVLKLTRVKYTSIVPMIKTFYSKIKWKFACIGWNHVAINFVGNWRGNQCLNLTTKCRDPAESPMRPLVPKA